MKTGQPSTRPYLSKAHVEEIVLKMNQSTLQRRHHSLRPVLRVQSHQDRADVTLHGRLGNTQKLSNSLVALAGNQKLQDLALAMAQIGVWHA